MEVIVQSATQIRWILLAACGVGCVLFLLTGVFAMRDLARASFRLERSTVVNRAVGSFLRALLCVLAGGAIYYVTGMVSRPSQQASAVIRPLTATVTPFTIVITPIATADVAEAVKVAAAVAQATPVTDVLSLPTPSLVDSSLVTVTATPFATVESLPTLAVIGATSGPATPTPLTIPTATRSALAAATPVVASSSDSLASLPTLPPLPTSAQVASAVQNAATPTLAPTETSVPAAVAQSPAIESNCGTPDLRLYKPAVGETISGIYSIVGDVILGSGRYKLEVLPAGETAWRFIWEGFKKVQGESLMPPGFPTANFANGAYFMKVTLVNPGGDEIIRCVVPFSIQN